MAPPAVRSGAGRVKAKLKAALAAGQYYEAHQMYRTLYFRLLAAEKYDELEPLLFEGARLLLLRDQTGSGVDLSRAYLDVLQRGALPVSESRCQAVARLYALVPESSAEKDGLMASALRWATPEGAAQARPRLHQLVAHALWQGQRYAESRHHFLLARDGSGCGAMMAEFHVRRGLPNEIDLFAAATVFQLLCLQQPVAAAWALQAYAQAHPTLGRGPPFPTPLLNFVWLLLVAIETRQTLGVFSFLIEKYRRCLDRDPSYFAWVDKIGQCFFGLPAPKAPTHGGLFSGLFDQMFSTLNEDSDDSGPADRSPTEVPSGSAGAASGQPSTSRLKAEEELD
eukprot:maker-scaffold846_size89341-snap-gene-0.11 protein:Tk05675 transcript:maker-scaffold846_size89341-snap-gene-0.11-mRNA-1 annotation:"upf0363 protein c7orf20"